MPTVFAATSSSRAPAHTPFSRNGDGRAALGPVLREYIVSEAMDALGIPTTRSLAAVDDRGDRSCVKCLCQAPC